MIVDCAEEGDASAVLVCFMALLAGGRGWWRGYVGVVTLVEEPGDLELGDQCLGGFLLLGVCHGGIDGLVELIEWMNGW